MLKSNGFFVLWHVSYRHLHFVNRQSQQQQQQQLAAAYCCITNAIA